MSDVEDAVMCMGGYIRSKSALMTHSWTSIRENELCLSLLKPSTFVLCISTACILLMLSFREQKIMDRTNRSCLWSAEKESEKPKKVLNVNFMQREFRHFTKKNRNALLFSLFTAPLLNLSFFEFVSKRNYQEKNTVLLSSFQAVSFCLPCLSSPQKLQETVRNTNALCSKTVKQSEKH